MGQRSSQLPPELAELAVQTGLSSSDLRRWYKQFRKDCPSGKLGLPELTRLYSQLFPGGEAAEFAARALRALDANGDGSVDFAELAAALGSASRAAGWERRLAWAFNVYDGDGDGFISRPEMLSMLQSVYRMMGWSEETQKDKTTAGAASGGQDEKARCSCLTPEEVVSRLFEAADVDGDSRISLEEFTQAARNDPSILSLLQTEG